MPYFHVQLHWIADTNALVQSYNHTTFSQVIYHKHEVCIYTAVNNMPGGTEENHKNLQSGKPAF
jgi:alanine dehydrogenase